MNKRSGSILNFIRGGQTLAHFIGMANQVIGYIFNFGAIAFLSTFSYLLYRSTDMIHFFAWFNYNQARYLVEWRERPYDKLWYIDDHVNGSIVEAVRVYSNDYIHQNYLEFCDDLWYAGTRAFMSLSAVGVIAVIYIWKKGKEFSSDEHIRGGSFVDEETFSKLLLKLYTETEKLTRGILKFGSIVIPREWEPQNFLIIGGPGSGKSVLYADFLESARKDKRRVIIHDRSGAYLEKFYREGIDIILNPLDIRTAPWSLYGECRFLHQFEMVAETLFPPTTKGDPFWYEAPRLVFVSLAMKELAGPNPSASRLSQKVLSCPLEELIKICKGTYAQSVIDENVVKQAQTLRSIVATKMRCLLLFEDDKRKGFSIRDWVSNDKGDATIFITSNKDMEAYLKPLITLWLEIASISILSLPPDLLRRIFLFYDELQALGRLNSLGGTLAEIRKYGGCAVLAFQGYSQGKKIYDEDGFDELADSCATYAFLRSNNAASAEWISKQLGKNDIYEAMESLSYGQERVRDGVNMSVNRNVREVIMPTQIQELPDLNGYLKVGRELPITKFILKFKNRKVVAPAFLLDETKFITAEALKLRQEPMGDTRDVEPSKNEIESDHSIDPTVLDDLIDEFSDDLALDIPILDGLDDVVVDFDSEDR
ncbi:MAG: type IV secretion system DNA-binding domain-containing protein [Anaerolineae bacterium]|nr:type IV secretion system DNA-binding domain-containing protein [Anaerolineae bacterium]